MKFYDFYLKETDKEYQIFCDLDGVLTNFDKAWKKLGISDKDFRSYQEEVGDAYAYTVLKKRGGIDFWIEMEWLDDGKDLWNFIKKYNPIILTTPANFEESKEGKKIWVQKNLGDDIRIIFSKNKEKYANSRNILIDDYQKKIDDWIEHGGIGILHKSAEKTIKKLKKYGF